MTHQDPRISSMFRRDCAAAIFAVVVVWMIYAFTFLMMRPVFDASDLTLTMAILGGGVLFLNTAAIVAMIQHYSEDRSAIYGIDIYYLDQLRRMRGNKGGAQ